MDTLVSLKGRFWRAFELGPLTQPVPSGHIFWRALNNPVLPVPILRPLNVPSSTTPQREEGQQLPSGIFLMDCCSTNCVNLSHFLNEARNRFLGNYAEPCL